MKPIRFATVLFMLGASVAVANASVATWSSYTATTATGDFGGVTITATTNSDAAFVGIANNHFGAFDGACGSWDGMLPLTHADEGLVASHVNGGDAQNFSFSSPLTEGLFYIENFDSSSEAKITVHGATHVALVDHSASITYSTISGNMGTLITSNRGFNGEGDAVLYFQGDVTGIEPSSSENARSDDAGCLSKVRHRSSCTFLLFPFDMPRPPNLIRSSFA